MPTALTPDFTVHRLGKERYGHDFTKELVKAADVVGSAVLLTGTPEVKWFKLLDDGTWEDVTSIFVDPDETILTGNKIVAYWFGAATPSTGIPKGTYGPRIKVDTDSGDILIADVREPRTGVKRAPLFEVVEDVYV